MWHTSKTEAHMWQQQSRSPQKFLFLPFLVWRDMLPKIQTHLDVSQTQQALSSFCERCAVRPDPREQTLIAQNEATYIQTFQQPIPAELLKGSTKGLL